MVGGKFMKTKTDCDCLLGFMSDDKIYKSNWKNITNNYIELIYYKL